MPFPFKLYRFCLESVSIEHGLQIAQRRKKDNNDTFEIIINCNWIVCKCIEK